AKSTGTAVLLKLTRTGLTGVPVLFAGPQGGYAGLDQINVPIPATLRGAGEIDINLTVDGRAANPVRVWLR
ncbi:MAG: hypothetical protein HOP19_15385, partial [Acidobacteria bacterium]|nr:hypothetical protein [Acidobacteriota bacterium]